MVVVGTDAAATVLAHLARQLITLHDQRADVAAQVEALAGTHPHVPGPDLHARDQGVPAAAVLAGRDPGQDLQAPAPSWPPTPGSLPSPGPITSANEIKASVITRPISLWPTAAS